MPSGSDFLKLALSQVGDRYVLGAPVQINNADPDAHDCSGLVEWASGRLGNRLQRHAQLQYNTVKAKGLDIPVTDALNIPGALLWKYTTATSSSRPRPIYHVGISVGNGKDVVEAKGSKWGVVYSSSPKVAVHRTDAAGDWDLAGLVPGLTYGKKNALKLALPLILGAGLGLLLIKKQRKGG